MWHSPIEEIERFIDRTHKITDMLNKASTVPVTTRLGTDITTRTKPGRPALAFVPRGGKKGEIVSNFAESTIVPLESVTEGRMVIDGIIVGLGEMRSDPVTCEVSRGRDYRRRRRRPLSTANLQFGRERRRHCRSGGRHQSSAAAGVRV